MKKKMIFLTVFLIFGLGVISQSLAQKFNFNDGTKQGWTLKGAFDENGSGPFASNFKIGRASCRERV